MSRLDLVILFIFNNYDDDLILDRRPVEEMEEALLILVRLAGNFECVPLLVDGLSSSLQSIFAAVEKHEHTNLDRLICKLLERIVKVNLKSLNGCDCAFSK